MIKKWDNWIFDSYKMPIEDLAFCRILFALFNLGFLFHFNFTWVAEYPDVFFYDKPGLPALYDGFPSKNLLLFYNISLIFLHFLLLFGKFTRWVSIGITLFLALGFSAVFCFGNTYHVILWILFPLVMSFSNWGGAMSLDSREQGETPGQFWPITLMSVLTGFAFFTSGLSKFMGGWLWPKASASWQYFHIVRNKIGRDIYLSDFVSTIHHPVFWEILDWLVVGFELGFLLAALSARWFRFFIVLAILFHFSNVLFLSISFGIHLAFFIVFLGWNLPEIQKNEYLIFIKQNIKTFIEAHTIFYVLGWATIYLLAFLYYDDHSRVDGLVPVEYPVYGIGVFICLYYFYYKLKSTTNLLSFKK